MLWHSLTIHDRRSANTRSEKPRIWEERAKIGPVALIKLAFMLSKTINLKTHARHFEEKCCNYILRLKWRRLIKWKGCPFALENKGKLAFFCKEAVFKRKFLKTYTDFRKPTHGLWKIDFSRQESVKSLQIGHREALSYQVWKLLVGFAFENGGSLASELLF